MQDIVDSAIVVGVCMMEILLCFESMHSSCLCSRVCAHVCLLSAAQEALQALCSALDIDFDPAMLTYVCVCVCVWVGDMV